MKTKIFLILGASLTPLLAGCASKPVALAPVGPNPNGILTAAASGRLEVFSGLTGRAEGDDPTWYQHTDYFIYDRHGRRLKLVNNNAGHYAQAPRLMTLPAGGYVVKARAEDNHWFQVPVVVKSGEITKVHLDGRWQPPADTPKSEIVTAPAGDPVGWRIASTKTTGAN